MDWSNVTVNVAAAGVIGVVWQWVRGSSVPHWASWSGAGVATVLAYLATERPEAPVKFYEGIDLGFHFLVWLILARGIAAASKDVRWGKVALAPPSKP